MDELELKRLLEIGKQTRERKVYEIKADEAEMDGNTLKGHPSVMGNLDKGNDVMFPGAYKKCLKGFLENGFIAWSHRWDQMIGYPTVAREEGKNLYSEAVFHSTPEAQTARTICMERLNAKKSVGLSVGFMPDYSEGLAFMDDAAKDYKTDAKVIYFASGAALLTFAKSNNYDMSLFDTKGIKACDSYCRGILLVDELFEWSPCAVPMNPRANATDAKQFRLSRKTYYPGQLCPNKNCYEDLHLPDEGWYKCGKCGQIFYAEEGGGVEDYHCYPEGDGVFGAKPRGYERHGEEPKVAVPTATYGKKSFPTNERDFEKFLRESGASRQFAVDIASVGFTKAKQRESAQASEADAPTPEPPPVDDGLLRKLQAAQLRFSPLLREVNHEF